MKAKIDEILDKLIAEVRQGKSPDDCLREYPEHADELRPLLYLASTIDALPRPEPAAEAAEAAIGKIRASLKKTDTPKALSLRRVFVLRPVVVRILAVVFLVLALGATTVMLSANSLPGDMLYPVKTLTERVQLFLTIDTEGKARLHVIFADKRTHEFEALLKPGTRINQDLLAEMLHETELAIECAGLLDKEVAVRIIEQIEKCNNHQMAVLESTRDCACDIDLALIEEAINKCLKQHECIDCMKGDNGSGNNCP